MSERQLAWAAKLRHPTSRQAALAQRAAPNRPNDLAKTGMQACFFMPPTGLAPLALYFRGGLLRDFSNIGLIGSINAMEFFPAD